MILDETLVQLEVQKLIPALYFGLIWSIFALLIAWSKGLFNPFPIVRFSPISGRDVLFGFLLFVTIQVIIIPSVILLGYYLATGHELNYDNLSKITRSWLDYGILLGGYIGLFVFYFRYLSEDKKAVLFGKGWFEDYCLGASTWFLVFPIILLWGQCLDILILIFLHRSPLEQLAVEQFRLAAQNPVLLIFMGLTIFCLVPIAEEFLFRGLLQSWLKTKLRSPLWGIIITAAVFAVFHFSESQGITNIQLLSSLFLLGCFLGFLYERQKSLWASIGLHSMFNFVSAVLVIFDQK